MLIKIIDDLDRVTRVEMSQLRTFLAVIRTGSFTRAAGQVRLGQSAVSASIAALERDLHTVLIDRSRTPVVPTTEGHALLPFATTILDEHQRAREAVDAVRGVLSGIVQVGTVAASGSVDMAAIVSACAKDYPAITLRLLQTMTGSAGLITGVRRGELDAALVAVAGPAPSDLLLHPLVVEPLVLLCHRDDPLASSPKVKVRELQERSYLALPQGWGARDIVDEHLGNPFEPLVEAADYKLLSALVAANLGFAVVPLSAVVEHEDLVVVSTDLVWELSLAVAAHRKLSPAAAVVVDRLLSMHSGNGPTDVPRRTPGV